MPRKSTHKVSSCVQTSRKENDEDGPSQDSVTSHSLASSQATLDVDQADRVSTQDPLPSPPTRANKVEFVQSLPEVVNIKSEGIEDHDKLLVVIPQNVPKSRPNESVEQRQRRLERKRCYAKKSITNETDEQRERRRQIAHQKYLKRKAKESVEEREQRLERKRQNYASRFKDRETVEQRKRRLERQRQINSKRKATESVEQRQQRLEKIREYELKRKANENDEKREQRLERARQYDLKRRTNPNMEQRELRRKRQREYVLKCKARSKINSDDQLANLPTFLAEDTFAQSPTKEEIIPQPIIKSEPSSQDHEQHCDNFPSESEYPSNETRLTRTSESKCFQTISKLVRGESPPDVIINIRKCVPKHRTNETVEQGEQRLPKLEHVTQTVSENVEKHELQDVSTRVADKTVEHEKQDELQINKVGGDIAKDVMKEVIQNYDFVKIKTEPNSQEYEQLCDVTASDSISSARHNITGDVAYKFYSYDGISSNYIKNEDDVLLDDEYEIERVLKLEIDIDSEGIQRFTSEGKT